MIPSSLYCLSFIVLCSPLVIAMEMPRSSSGVVHKKPQGPIPASSSMAFPPAQPPMPTSQSMAFPPKKNNPGSGGSLRGSIIQRMGRTASELLLGRRSASGEVIPEKPKEAEPIPAAAKPSISAPLTTAALKAVTPPVTEKKEFIIGKPIYTITHEAKECIVRIEGRCDAVYRVSCIKDFKDNGYLQREEVLSFIDDLFQKMGNRTIGSGYSMSPKQRENAARQALKYIKKNQHKHEFNIPFYLVRKDHNLPICVFESDLKEINLEKTKKILA